MEEVSREELVARAMDAVGDLGQFNSTERLAAALTAVRALGDAALSGARSSEEVRGLREALAELVETIEQAFPALAHQPPMVRARAALSGAQVGDDGWRDIADAPRDGGWFMTHSAGQSDEFYPNLDFAKWDVEGEYWCKAGCGFDSATHWRPLPPAPLQG